MAKGTNSGSYGKDTVTGSGTNSQVRRLNKYLPTGTVF